jgi:hypothetical protein
MQSSFAVGGGGRRVVESTPRFKTVLSARNNNERPSGECDNILIMTNKYIKYLTISFIICLSMSFFSQDLEYAFREVSDRVKVVTKPKLSGAHFHCVKERIAIRAYYPCDLESLEPLPSDDEDFDGLNSFLKSFQLALVLFVLPVNDPMFQQQLNDITLHFHRAQRLVGRFAIQGTVSVDRSCKHVSWHRRTTHIFVSFRDRIRICGFSCFPIQNLPSKALFPLPLPSHQRSSKGRGITLVVYTKSIWFQNWYLSPPVCPQNWLSHKNILPAPRLGSLLHCNSLPLLLDFQKTRRPP